MGCRAVAHLVRQDDGAPVMEPQQVSRGGHSGAASSRAGGCDGKGAGGLWSWRDYEMCHELMSTGWGGQGLVKRGHKEVSLLSSMRVSCRALGGSCVGGAC